jgi:hypothetical protein
VVALKVTVVGPHGVRVGRFRVDVKPVIKTFAATPPKDEVRPRPKPSAAQPRTDARPARPRMPRR